MSGLVRASGLYIHPQNGDDMSDFTDMDTGRSDNTYESLNNVSSRASLVQITPPPSTVVAYQPTVSHRSGHSHYGSSRFLRRHRCNGLKRGKFSSSRSSEKVKSFYMKVKIWLCLLSAFNVVVAAVVVVLLVKLIGPDSESAASYFLDTGDGKSFRLCTKCQPLKAKMGHLSTSLINDIQSSKYPGFCCFRRVDQLLDMVDKYNKAYVAQELENLSELLKSPSNKPQEPVAAHLTYNEARSDSVLGWMSSGVGIRLAGFNMKQHKCLVIKDPGYYYMYSHLQFLRIKASHTVIVNMADSNIKFEGIGQRSSLIQGVLRLSKGDQISVKANTSCIDTNESYTNYFGIFKL